MGFINAYKRLEKICGEVMDDERKVSAYIDKMKEIYNGSDYVIGWDEDLKMLKHYRWIRNQIVHEPNCTEENMCTWEDEAWLEEFYQRILNCSDPLALYAKAVKRSAYQNQKTNHQAYPSRQKTNSNQYQHNEKDAYETSEVSFLGVVLFFLLVLFLFLLFVNI